MHTVKLQGSSESFPVPKILCVGRNYAEHAREMEADLPDSPVVFMKPPTAIIHDGDSIRIPPISNDVHHEVEMTVLIGETGKNIERSEAMKHVAGYGIGLDMTLRDVQTKAKKDGLPWLLSKGFDTSAVVSDFVPSSRISNPHGLDVTLSVNGKTRQQSNTQHFIFKIDELIAYISRVITLERGDVLFTGTPQGVARVVSGDRLEASLLAPDGTVLTSLKVSVQ